MDEIVETDEPVKPKFRDELITGAISLIAGAFMTKLVDEAYAKWVIARRNKPIEAS